MLDIRLIVIDFDGTLMGSGNEFHLYNTFRDKIQEFQMTKNAAWAVCTGRSRESFRHVFESMRLIGIVPNYLIIRHAYIYSLTRFGYMPHFTWNLRTRHLLWMERLRVCNVLEECCDMAAGSASRGGCIRRTKNWARMRFDSEETTASVANMVREKIKPYRNLRMLKFVREIDIRLVPFTKGLAVSELARHIGIGKENVLTIGDGHNDISMFDANVASYTGCPVNAEPEVMEIVFERRGHIAKSRFLTGVVEILDAHTTGTVCSDLPDGWKKPELRENPSSNHIHHGRHESHVVRNITCLVATLYVVLMVFASFKMIPHLSGPIMMPIRLLVKLLVKITAK